MNDYRSQRRVFGKHVGISALIFPARARRRITDSVSFSSRALSQDSAKNGHRGRGLIYPRGLIALEPTPESSRARQRERWRESPLIFAKADVDVPFPASFRWPQFSPTVGSG